MQEGVIIDSVVHGLSTLLNNLPGWLTAEMMLVVQNILNFFIPSGSGLAAAIMPIMVPLADLTDVNRQIAVLAYQFGDGYSNLILSLIHIFLQRKEHSCCMCMRMRKVSGSMN